jgi:hypothetical protein
MLRKSAWFHYLASPGRTPGLHIIRTGKRKTGDAFCGMGFSGMSSCSKINNSLYHNIIFLIPLKQVVMLHGRNSEKRRRILILMAEKAEKSPLG